MGHCSVIYGVTYCGRVVFVAEIYSSISALSLDDSSKKQEYEQTKDTFYQAKMEMLVWEERLKHMLTSYQVTIVSLKELINTSEAKTDVQKQLEDVCSLFVYQL